LNDFDKMNLKNFDEKHDIVHHNDDEKYNDNEKHDDDEKHDNIHHNDDESKLEEKNVLVPLTYQFYDKERVKNIPFALSLITKAAIHYFLGFLF
jgi:hypothetical protein